MIEEKISEAISENVFIKNLSVSFARISVVMSKFGKMALLRGYIFFLLEIVDTRYIKNREVYADVKNEQLAFMEKCSSNDIKIKPF